MADSGTSSRDEKASIVHKNTKPSKGGFFSKKRVAETVNADEKTLDVTADVKPQEDEVPPVSVAQLFR